MRVETAHAKDNAIITREVGELFVDNIRDKKQDKTDPQQLSQTDYEYTFLTQNTW